MFGRMAVKLAHFALRRADLSLADRNSLIVHILDRVGALPLRDMIIANEEGALLVNGRTLSVEGARSLRESARAALRNKARKFVHDQVLFTAVTIGVHNLEKVEQSIFSRAAIWYGQQENEILALIAQEDPQRELGPGDDDTEI